jgi:hypothetical protein
LICQFDRDRALDFVKACEDTLDSEAALAAARKYGAGACMVYISKWIGGSDSTIPAEALGMILLDFTENANSGFVCESDAELGSHPELTASLHAIDGIVALLQEQADSYSRFTRAFTFPLYHAAKRSANVRRTMQLLFSHFLLAALAHVDGSKLLRVVLDEIRGFTTEEYRSLVHHFLYELEYKRSTADMVVKMSVVSCQRLLVDAFEARGVGVGANSGGNCHSCGKALGLRFDPILVFPCGHVFHNNAACCPTPEKCHWCAEHTEMLTTSPAKEKERVTARRVQQLMRRMDFSLKKNYGDSEESGCAAVTYFANRPAIGDGRMSFTMSSLPPVPRQDFVVAD